MAAVRHQSRGTARWPVWGTLTSWGILWSRRVSGSGRRAPAIRGAPPGRSSLEAAGGQAGQDVALEDQEEDDRGNRGHGGSGDDEVHGCSRRPRDPDIDRFPGWGVAALDK